MTDEKRKELVSTISDTRKQKKKKNLGKSWTRPKVSITPVGKKEEAELRDPEKHGFGKGGRKSRRNADGSTSYISKSVMGNYRVNTYGGKAKKEKK